MERSQGYFEKNLNFTYDDYLSKGKSLSNLKIDKYVIYEKIGQGSNGQVYKGMDDVTKKTVAVKLMNIRSINEEEKITIKLIKQRLCESQPRLMQQCNSPNLIKCYDIYRNDDLKILILEYCNGKTLQKQINQKGRIPQKEAVEIVKHIIIGLMELHRNKIIHRDLKAQNIMSHNGTYKIIDFGFSKKLQIAQQNAQVRGTALGTITTMAPQVMSKRNYGLKADIWSLGIIFFQMIYGIYPYDSLSAFELYKEIKSKKLFANNSPLVINGFKPSLQSYEFIKFLIVFDTDQRPNWKQVSEHPLIKNKNEQMSQRFIKKVDVVVNNDISQMILYNSFQVNPPMNNQVEENEENAQQEERMDFSQFKEEERQIKQFKEQSFQDRQNQQQTVKYKKQLQIAQKEKQQMKKIKYLQQTMMVIKKGQKKQKQQTQQIAYSVHQMKKEQIQKNKKEQNMEQNEQYKFTQRAHLQCLKTQFIYRQIVNPILSTNYLNLQDRTSIEFLYLLLARCFNNMSPIQFELEQRKKNKEIIENLNNQITSLYKQVKQKFLHFSNRLTEKQNKWYSMVGDFFIKKVQKNKFEEKDKLLTGIEVINYTKQQQIEFTHKYFTVQIRKKIEGIANISNVNKKLNKYVEINSITQQYLSNNRITFIDAVKQILS